MFLVPCHHEKDPIFAGNMKQTIDTYKLTSMEEPSDEILSQIMREAAEDARKSRIRVMEDKSIESLKQEFIQEIMSEQSFDTLKEWLYMHDEARYVASLTSKEPELIEYNKEFEKSLRQGQRNN